MKQSLKAITPVVATALLLVVVVVAVVGFQTWFNSYSSGLFTKIDQQSSSNSLSVKGLKNNILYLQSGSDANLTLLKVENYAGKTMCSFSGPTNVNSQGLVGWWTFNKGTGNIVYDKSGFGNNGMFANYITLNITQVNGNNVLFTDNGGMKNNSLNDCIINNTNSLILSDNKIGSTHNLTLNNSPAITTNTLYNISCGSGPKWINTKLGDGLNLNGITDKIIVPDNPSLDFNGSNQYAMVAIYNLNAPILNSKIEFPILIGKRPWLVGGYMTHFGWSGYINNQFCNIGQNYGYNIYYSKLVNPGINFYIGQYNGTQQTIYDNNVLAGSKNTTVLLGSNKGTDLQIGPINGTIDEVRIYNRSLSLSEIKTLYWYSIRPLQAGINQIDLSSCNLVKGQDYDIVGFTNNAQVDQTMIAR